tara:strand:+ start:7979 stop:8830 length:852 start_codon:yes stop_codon:yes gene_type:complete
MALDYITNGLEVPEYLDFTTRTEPTRMAGKKYVINNDTDEVIGIVGSKFNSVTHTEFYDRVWDTMSEQLGTEAMEGVQVKWNTARNGAFAMLDASMPSTKALITTDKQQTEISQRVIALHGVDGLCSNQVFFGAIDFFCTNGMIRGEHDKVRRKNTTNFNMATFIKELENANSDFYSQAEQLQEWARTPLEYNSVRDMLHSLMGSEKKGDKMLGLYGQEIQTRGHNAFALYSAFTNYASYADERNGFKLRNTGNDTNSVSMWGREQEVTKWVSSKQFKELVAA